MRHIFPAVVFKNAYFEYIKSRTSNERYNNRVSVFVFFLLILVQANQHSVILDLSIEKV